LRAVFLPSWHDNPYQELLASGLEARGIRVQSLPRRTLFLHSILREGCPDIVHVHAPDHFVVYRGPRMSAFACLVVFAAQLWMLRALGARVVWTAHDAINHERRHPLLDRLCRRWTSAVASAVIVHCEAARRVIAERFAPRREHKLHVVPHGHYLDRYARRGPPEDRRAARATLRLPLDPTILLFFGNLRRHKGVPELIDAFRRLDRQRVLLVVAGEPFTPEVAAEIGARIGGRTDVEFRPGFVPDAEVGRYLEAADAVVCPFTSSLTSGSVALAMSFGRACIAPRLGCIPEMVGEDGGILYDYDRSDSDALLHALEAAVDGKDRLDAMGERSREAIRARDWSSIAAATVDVYRSCFVRRRASRP
jgi:glycosyltransferase involved in cell wall biosynthesis